MLNWTNERKARLIGTLFHDIGKFQYRAEKTTIRHEENSARFIREHFGKHDCLKDFLEDAIRIAETHHHAAGDYAMRRADQIASGEREAEEARESRRPLLSVFNHINNIRQIDWQPSTQSFFPPGLLSTENIFPREFKVELTVEELRELHKPHWDAFVKEVEALPLNMDFPELYNTLLAVLEKWTSNVCSAGYNTLPDISLYDHSRVTAAYTDCYAETEVKEKPFLVVEADISGIQNFIYKIANISGADQKGTAKILRGRSFLISLYTEAVSRYVLDQLNLLNVHILMHGGGGFTILLPNSKDAHQKLTEIRKKVNKWLIEEFGSEIGLVLVWETFTEKDIQQFNIIKRNMLQKIADEKFHRSKDFLNDFQLWGPHPFDDQKMRVCNLCSIYFYKNGNSEKKRCWMCDLQVEIGQKLPHTNTLLLVHNYLEKIPDLEGIKPVRLKALDQTWFFVPERANNQTEVDLIKNTLAQIEPGTKIDLIHINDPEFNDPRFLSISQNVNQSLSHQFVFIGNYAPRDDKNDVKSFEELAHTSVGYPLLGILRMDVDSLGAIFAYGFEEKHQTISRIANLSRLFVQFFSGYLNHLAEVHQIYITYSGGDDLFVVGGWTHVLDFARQVNKDFRKFVSYNPHVTISGGMTIVKPSFPIRLGAQQAGDAEDKAKMVESDSGNEKNAMSLFGEAYHWEDFENLIVWADKIVAYIDNVPDDVSLRSLIRYLKQLRDASFGPDGSQDPHWLPKVRHKIHYAFRRRAGIDARKLENAEEDEITTLLAPIIHDARRLEQIHIPASYILLKTRKYSDKQK